MLGFFVFVGGLILIPFVLDWRERERERERVVVAAVAVVVAVASVCGSG